MHTNARVAQITSPEIPATSGLSSEHLRASGKGKFIWAGEEKFYVRGVTYGPFRPGPEGDVYRDRKTVERDFAQMAANGFNAVRTYDVPPRWLLDAAGRHGLRVMVGLQGEQRASFLDNKKVARISRELVRNKVRACANHPAILSYVIANEIPAPIVRWLGARRVEKFLEELYWIGKAEDPEGLFCYANYPTTEYLDLPFLDLFCFNVYLESPSSYEAYLARLQNLAGHRPFLMAEVGLDSLRNGEVAQSETLDWQIRAAFAAGCAGAFVFAWTDDWYSRGRDVDDWAFGLTDRAGDPKLALQAVRKAFAAVPFPRHRSWPGISVVVCSFNGSRTIRDCLEGLTRLQYPNYEVIVVDDGSTDQTTSIARGYPFRVISTENRGLSAARNTGLEAASGEIVAYIDDDASPDPDWLTYLAATFQEGNFAGVGGPNIPFPNDGPIAWCIANAPGGPTHVLLSDTEAEHIPGCNMAFRKSILQAIGGFDSQFRVAGDDVDACWRIQRHGGKLGFSPAAMVWHHTRGSVKAYWKQQLGYGKAEALLERKWPEKYNTAGQPTWAGRVYTNEILRALERRRGRIYQGTFGSAAYARLYFPPPGVLASIPLMPEWYLISAGFAALSALGYAWEPLQFAALPAILALGLPPALAAFNARRAHVFRASMRPSKHLKLRALIVCLHVIQPLARLIGHLNHGLTPWRWRCPSNLSFPRSRIFWLASQEWRDSTERLLELEANLRATGAIVRRGNDFDHWDLEITAGTLGHVRILMAEEFAEGKQLVRVRTWPRLCLGGLALSMLFAALSCAAAFDHAPVTAAILGIFAVLPVTFMVRDCAAASGTATACALVQMGFKE